MGGSCQCPKILTKNTRRLQTTNPSTKAGHIQIAETAASLKPGTRASRAPFCVSWLPPDSGLCPAWAAVSYQLPARPPPPAMLWSPYGWGFSGLPRAVELGRCWGRHFLFTTPDNRGVVGPPSAAFQGLSSTVRHRGWCPNLTALSAVRELFSRQGAPHILQRS